MHAECVLETFEGQLIVGSFHLTHQQNTIIKFALQIKTTKMFL